MDATNFPNDLITPDDAGKLLGITGHTIRRWCKMGTLPAFKVGARLRISQADVVAQMKRIEVEGKPTLPTRAEATAKAKRTEKILREAGSRN